MSITSLLRPYRTGVWAIVGLLAGWQGPTPLSAWQAQGTLIIEPKIVVLEGDDGINVVKKKIAASPVVEVRDQNDLPIAGAAVLFSLPKSGPGGSFANGMKELSLVSDPMGRAAVGEMLPSGKGAFQITVRAIYKDRSVTAAISQTNFRTVASARKAGKIPGSSASSAPATANVKIPPYGMAISGGAAVGIVAVLAAGGAAAYVLLKHKGAVTNPCAADLVAYNVVEAGAVACSSFSSSCDTLVQSAVTAANNYCACTGGDSSALLGFDTLVNSILPTYDIAAPSSCTGN